MDAINGIDFVRPVGGTITISSGNLSSSVSITTLDDSVGEIDEKLIFSMYDPVNAKLSKDSIGIGKILDNDTGAVATKIQSGSYSNCILTEAGQIKCWGASSLGRLGIGSSHIGDEPGEMGNNLRALNLPSAVSYTAVAQSANSACFLRTDGKVNCVGGNNSRELGIGAQNNYGSKPGDLGANTPLIDFSPLLVTQITAGDLHFCALLSNNTATCWGENARGQLGIGNTNDQYASSTAIDFGPYTVKKIAAGGDTSCAILSNDQIKCWGYNNKGQLGLGDTLTRGDAANEMGTNLPFVDLGSGRTVKDISLGFESVCALMENNQLKCWGENAYGRILYTGGLLGDGPNEMGDNLLDLNLGTGRTVKQISLGFSTACALLDNNRIKCWGGGYSNVNYGRIGLPEGINIGDNASEIGDNIPYLNIGDTAGIPNTAIKVMTSNINTCYVLAKDNKYYCIGNGSYGGNGQGSTNHIGDDPYELGNYLSPIDFGTGLSAVAVATNIPNAYSQCVILNNDAVKCWGASNFVSTYTYPSPVSNESFDVGTQPWHMANLKAVNFGTGRTVKDFSYTDTYGCAILDNDKVKCWGYRSSTYPIWFTASRNHYGYLLEDLGDAIEYLNIDTSSKKILKIEAGPEHMCILYDSFELQCSAGNAAMLGMGGEFTTANSFAFTGSYKFVDFGTGRYPINFTINRHNTCVILDNFETKCFGAGNFGVNLNGSTNAIGDTLDSIGNGMPFLNFGTNKKTIQISASYSAYCAQFADNSAKCWGQCIYGVCANGTTADWSIGNSASEIGDNLASISFAGGTLLQLAANTNHYNMCAYTDNAGSIELRCWGEGSSGKLGNSSNGHLTNTNHIINLGTSKSAKQFNIGDEHACAILSNTEVKCWGANTNGQLGLGDINNRGDNANEMGDNLPAIGF